MSKDLIGSIVRALVGVPLHRQGVLLDVVNRLGNTSSDGDGWCAHLIKVVQDGLPQEKETVTAINGFPELIGTVTVPATTSKFVAKDRFVVNTKRNSPVKISAVGDNFKAWFGDKVEDPIGEQTLCYAKLRKASVDMLVIDELGGGEKSETTLSEMFSLMEKQPNGEKGALFNSGWANIFYVQDNIGVLRKVVVYWFIDGWDVIALPRRSPVRGVDGSQVFSRDLVLESSGTSVPA